ncbi:MAG: hypothetical protein QXJ64_03225 [Thermosphaera sp.]
MPVSIIGGRGSGKSVFVSLLIYTAIKYSTEMKYHFRVYMDPLTNKIVGEMLKSLKKSLWPPATLKGTVLEYTFSFGYSNIIQRAILQGLRTVGIPVSPGEFFDVITFKLIDISGEDVEMLSKYVEEAEHVKGDIFEHMPPALQYALNSDVLVFLIDSAKVTDDRSDKRYDEMIDYDILMAQLYSSVAKYRRKYRKKKTPLYPVFVLTKFDALDPKIMTGLGVSPDVTSWVEKLSHNRNLRWRFFELFMKKFFEQSLSQIFGGALKGVKLEDAPIFISYVNTELNEDGILVPKVVTVAHAVEIMYSETEYKAFIDYFGKIAGKISDKKKSYEERFVDAIE